MKKNCDNCKYDAWDYVCAKPCSNCITKGEGEPSYWEASENYKPMTNADRIRAMTDEELAEFICLSPEMEFDVCRFCQYGNPTPMDDRGQCPYDMGRCYAVARAEAMKKWLQQPAEGD